MGMIKGFFAALSTIKELLGLFKSLYSAYEKRRMEKDIDKVNKAIDKGATDEIEKAIGSDNAGKPAIRRDGVQERGREDPS